ncbi:MAG: ABC transporter permease [bacterium]
MSLPLFIANRYVKSKKESKFISLISVISICGIALGVAVLIMALAILNGFEQSIAEKIVQFNSHIKITGFGNRNLPPYQSVIEGIKEKADSSLSSISPFVSKYAIVRSSAKVEGILITGFMKEMDNSDIKNLVFDGDYNHEKVSDNYGITIGKKLAEKLFVKVGDRLTIFTLKNDQVPSIDNPPAIEQFIVTGIYESGMAEYDDMNAIIDFKVGQELFGMDDKISGYNLRVNNIAVIESLSIELQKFLRYPYYVRSIFKIHQNIFTWLELQKEPIPIVLGLIIIVAVFNIVGTLLMIVLEKTEAIGILKSLGAVKKQIIGIFLLQGIYLALIGIAAGNLLAFILSYLQSNFGIVSLPDTVYFLSSVPIAIRWEHYAIVSASAFFMSIITAFIPSYIASRVKPISALRFD